MFENVSPWGCAWIIITLAILYLAFLILLLNDFSLDEVIGHFIR